jgi:hypothetical protein
MYSHPTVCYDMHCFTSNTLQAKLEADLSQEPTDLEQLKFVLNAIAAVANSRMDMELEYLDVMERYRTLKHYEVKPFHTLLHQYSSVPSTLLPLLSQQHQRNIASSSITTFLSSAKSCTVPTVESCVCH